MLGMFFILHLHMETICGANWYGTPCVLVCYCTAFQFARPRFWYAWRCNESSNYVPKPFVLHADYKGLSYINSQQNLNTRYTKWVEFL